MTSAVLSILALAAAGQEKPPARVTDTEVAQAIAKGIAWLKTAPSHASHAGIPNSDELILWTYVHANVPESDPSFQKYLKAVLEAPLEKTYKGALQAMILEEVDRAKYQWRIAQCAQFLVDCQCVNGQWSYGNPTDAVKDMPKGSPDVASGGGALRFDFEGRRVKPKIGKKVAARKTRDGPDQGDNSNTQYAALGLRACFDAGVMIPEDTILRAVKWWRESLLPDEGKDNGYGGVRGWNYTNQSRDPDKKPYHAMTAGGVGSLVIYNYILDREWKRDSFVKAGLNWLTSKYAVSHSYYYMYGLERACILHGVETLGKHDWYQEGARLILKAQNADGSWGKDGEWNKATWDTCFAILFLKRATRPLVATEPGGRKR